MNRTYYKLQNGNIASVGFDEGCYLDSPRTWSNLSTFLTWHREYNSPDENNYTDFEYFLAEFDVEYTGDKNKDLSLLIENADKKGYFLFPVYMYEHGLITFSLNDFNDRWDSGFCGVMYAKKDFIYSETNLTENTENLREKVKEYFSCELKDYEMWSNGWIMDYLEFDVKEKEIIDSCTGFYGTDIHESGIYSEYELDKAVELAEFNSMRECIGDLFMNDKL